jgi:hypothetical protein
MPEQPRCCATCKLWEWTRATETSDSGFCKSQTSPLRGPTSEDDSCSEHQPKETGDDS